ncbi:single-stranded DNA-binding protein [soil metagenome]
MDNTVTVVGNLTRDPELRYTPSGQTIATFGLAVNRRWQNRQTQEWEEQNSFFDIKAWANLAENVAESIQRGTRVVVTGRLEQRSWETDNGDKRSKVEVVADDIAPSLRWATAQVQKIDRRDSSGGGGGAGSGGGSPAPRPAANEPTTYDGEEPF